MMVLIDTYNGLLHKIGTQEISGYARLQHPKKEFCVQSDEPVH